MRINFHHIFSGHHSHSYRAKRTAQAIEIDRISFEENPLSTHSCLSMLELGFGLLNLEIEVLMRVLFITVVVEIVKTHFQKNIWPGKSKFEYSNSEIECWKEL